MEVRKYCEKHGGQVQDQRKTGSGAENYLLYNNLDITILLLLQLIKS